MSLILQGRRSRYCVTYTWPVNFILPRKKMALYCVTFTCPSSSKKKPGQYRKKFNILPASAASKALQNPGNTSTELANPLKKIWQTRQLISKNEIENEKNDWIAALSIIINCFCRQNVTEKLENSGKDFNWRGDREEDATKEPDDCLRWKQMVRLLWFYIILWLWNLIPKIL